LVGIISSLAFLRYQKTLKTDPMLKVISIMKRTCLQKNTNTVEQNTCEFHLSAAKLRQAGPAETSIKERLFDPKDNQLVKSFVRMKISIFLLISFLSLSALAQVTEKNPWFTSKDLLIKNKTYFELFGGAVYPQMIYSNKAFNKAEHDPLFLYDAGVSLRFQRGKWFSFSPRFTFFGQGISMKDELKYTYKANYISFSLPFEMQFDLGKEMNKSVSKLFIYTGPYIATPVSVHIQTKNHSNWLSISEMKRINWGAEAGIGIRIPTFTLEGRSFMNIRLSYLHGFNDTYSEYEKKLVDQSIKDEFYVDNGKRFNSSIKLTICIEIPLKAKKFVSFTAGGDGKKNYKRVVVVDEK
jgi:hypothetical protein